MPPEFDASRRRVVCGLALGAAAFFTVPGLFAQELALTPRQTEGPFYPDHLPLDRDNDLIIISDSTTPAVGEITHLSGRVLDARGEPIKDALVEIWQVDSRGVYLHTGSDNAGARDKNFQGYGRFQTASGGEYRFRTIKPAPYPGRTPHIHFAVTAKGRERLTTQLYVKGEPRNERDGILRSIRDPRQREAVVVAFAPLPQSRAGELAARFDIVLGLTPQG